MMKNIWKNDDFEMLDFHDCGLYSIIFPDESLLFIMDIDYIFEWILDRDKNTYSFKVAPCTLIFKNVIDLQMSLSFNEYINIDILSVSRMEVRRSQDSIAHKYCIETDRGSIEFISYGFQMNLNRDPILSDAMSLGRERNL